MAASRPPTFRPALALWVLGAVGSCSDAPAVSRTDQSVVRCSPEPRQPHVVVESTPRVEVPDGGDPAWLLVSEAQIILLAPVVHVQVASLRSGYYVVTLELSAARTFRQDLPLRGTSVLVQCPLAQCSLGAQGVVAGRHYLFFIRRTEPGRYVSLVPDNPTFGDPSSVRLTRVVQEIEFQSRAAAMLARAPSSRRQVALEQSIMQIDHRRDVLARVIDELAAAGVHSVVPIGRHLLDGGAVCPTTVLFAAASRNHRGGVLNTLNTRQEVLMGLLEHLTGRSFGSCWLNPDRDTCVRSWTTYAAKVSVGGE